MDRELDLKKIFKPYDVVKFLRKIADIFPNTPFLNKIKDNIRTVLIALGIY